MFRGTRQVETLCTANGSTGGPSEPTYGDCEALPGACEYVSEFPVNTVCLAPEVAMRQIKISHAGERLLSIGATFQTIAAKSIKLLLQYRDDGNVSQCGDCGSSTSDFRLLNVDLHLCPKNVLPKGRA